MRWLAKGLSVAAIIAAIILLAASSSGCGEECLESGVLIGKECYNIVCCDAAAGCGRTVQYGFSGNTCSTRFSGSSGSGFRLTGP
jgi:hypothetical protein